MYLKSFIFSILVCFCTASPLTPNTVHQLTFFTGLNNTGDSVTFRSKLSNVTEWNFLLPQVQSMCSVGAWVFYEEENFKSAFTVALPWQEYFNPVACYPNMDGTDLGPVKSLRFLGPRDTATPGITFYGMQTYTPGLSNVLDSDEIFVEGAASNNLGFTALAMWVTGNTNWTVFEEESFTGRASCLILTDGDNEFEYWGFTAEPYQDLPSEWHVPHRVRSVVRGCQNPAAPIISPKMRR